MTAKETYEVKRELDEFLNMAYSPGRSVNDSDLSAMESMRTRIDKAEAALGGTVFRVPAENMSDLQARIEKINKRAAKLGTTPITIERHETEMVERRGEENAFGEREVYYIEFVYIVVKGETPRVAGWEFIATLEHDEAGTLIRRVPSFEAEIDLSAYRDASPEHCDHCGFKRNRKDTYLVSDGTDIKQVGRQCLKDFTGAHNPEQVARMAESLRDLFEDLGAMDDDDFGGSHGERHYNIEDYLMYVSAAIMEHGWLPRSKAEFGQPATADIAFDQMRERNLRFKYLDPDYSDQELAKATLTLLRSEAMEEKTQKNPENDYLWNLYIACQRDYINSRKIGLVASAIPFYQREQEFELRRQKAAESPKTFVGEEGQRQDFILTLVRINWIEDRYSYNGGSKPLYIFQDPEGNEVKWFASNPPYIPGREKQREWIKEGQTYKIKATVKRHEDHPQYGKSTLITRSKVLEVVDG